MTNHHSTDKVSIATSAWFSSFVCLWTVSYLLLTDEDDETFYVSYVILLCTADVNFLTNSGLLPRRFPAVTTVDLLRSASNHTKPNSHINSMLLCYYNYFQRVVGFGKEGGATLIIESIYLVSTHYWSSKMKLQS